jgi:hypothetical protein
MIHNTKVIKYNGELGISIFHHFLGCMNSPLCKLRMMAYPEGPIETFFSNLRSIAVETKCTNFRQHVSA